MCENDNDDVDLPDRICYDMECPSVVIGPMTTKLPFPDGIFEITFSRKISASANFEIPAPG